jgi:RNA polymerase sigma factor (sigma-70 family)
MTSASVKLLRTQSDERLVALAAAGHERAFEAIVERYRRPLLRHCKRYLPEARAEDALQQALVAAWSALRRGDDVRELQPWLHRIVQNTSLNALRAAGYDYEQLRDTLAGDGGPAELAEHSAVLRQALAGLAALPERQREALLQIAVEGRSQNEVADELGLSHGAVRQLVHRARNRLRTAATALTPLPLAGWLASGGGSRGDLVARVAELVAGAGGGATLAKAGAVAAVAGGAVGAPVVIDRVEERPAVPERRSAIAAPAKPRSEPREQPAAPAEPVAVAEEQQEPADAEPAARAGGSPGRREEERSGSRGSDEARRDEPAQEEPAERSGPPGGGHEDSDSAGDDRSGPGGGGGGHGKPDKDDDDSDAGPSVPLRADDPPEPEDDEPENEPEPLAGVDSSGPGSGDEPAKADADTDTDTDTDE